MDNGACKWRKLIEHNGLKPSSEQFAKLTAYADLLVEWNAKVNLVSRQDMKCIWQRHIVHSISILFELRFPRSVEFADIGSGGGLPAVPLSIMMPGHRLTMFESIRKKCIALEDITSRLELSNIVVVNQRVEDAAKSANFKAKFHVVTARAVASLSDLIRWTRPIVRGSPDIGAVGLNKSGELFRAPFLVALKGGDITQEIEEAESLSTRIFSHTLNFTGIEETGLVDKKIVIATYDTE